MFVWGPLCGIQAANPLHKTLYAAFWVRGRERQSQREYWGRGPHTGAGPSYGGGALIRGRGPDPTLHELYLGILCASERWLMFVILC
jgi:hypothetical protein